jgi:hypothetical protein
MMGDLIIHGRTILRKMDVKEIRCEVVGCILLAQYMIQQGRSMLIVLAMSSRLTLKIPKNKKSSVLLSWCSGTPHTGTRKNRTDKMHR